MSAAQNPLKKARAPWGGSEVTQRRVRGSV